MLKLTIATPDRKVVGPIEVQSVTVPGSKGEMTILPGHARIVSNLDIGMLTFREHENKHEVAALSWGFLEVTGDEVKVLAERFELAKEIDVDRARRAQEKAEKELQAKEHFEEDQQKWLSKWESKLRRSHIRQQAARFLLPPH